MLLKVNCTFLQNCTYCSPNLSEDILYFIFVKNVQRMIKKRAMYSDRSGHGALNFIMKRYRYLAYISYLDQC